VGFYFPVSSKRSRQDSDRSHGGRTTSTSEGSLDLDADADDQAEGCGDDNNEDDDRSARLVEEIWMDKHPGRPTERVRSNRIYVVEPKAGRLTCQDTRKVRAQFSVR
jgi:hypothetical protein